MATDPLTPDTHGCFHCGQPLELIPPPELDVQGETHQFCCQGCKAVCEAIVASGNEKYYEYRDQADSPGGVPDLEQVLDKLLLFDKPEIQKDFVRHLKDGEEAWLILENIHCAACLWLNERHIRGLDGVLDCQMDYTSQQARVRWDPARIKLSEILTAITQIGYIAHPFDPSHREALQKEQQQRSVQRLIFALILGMVIMNFSIASYVFGAPDASGEYPLWIRIARWTNLFTSGVLLAYSGQLFFRNAWNDLKHRRFGMDTPVALGMALAWLGSLKATVTGHGDVYFESIAMFVVFLLIARHIELRARVEASTLLDKMARIIPKTTKRLIGGGVEEVLVADLSPGDRIQLGPGETVPTDGILLEPNADFDESLLTGESLPVQKKAGESIPGGAVNVDQTITLEVKKPSTHSTLVEIQQLARSSLNTKPVYIQLADRLAGKFIVAILSIAALTLLSWLVINPDAALSHTIAVLIVTCPCALALAAPVALTLCSGGLAKLGIVPVQMSAIEAAAKANVLIFDKTGTLTQGVATLHETLCVDENSPDKLLAIAAALETGSEHPFARAFLAATPHPNLEVTGKQNHPGFGIEGSVAGQHWKLGNDSFVPTSTQWLCAANNAETVSNWQRTGGSVLYLGTNNTLQGVFFLTDPLRKGAKAFVSDARQRGFSRILVLSGDHPDTTRAVASLAGIDETHGGLAAAEKLAFVQQLQTDGQTVMMIGDGINDAPVLAAADLSLTISDATDLAKSHSDLIMLRHDFDGLSEAIDLMKKTRQLIIENLVWAASYNLLAIPAAAVGLVTPWMAAIGMTSSSLIVVVNSLRLKRVIKPGE